MHFSIRKMGRFRCVLFYTPVNAKLQKMGEQLGDYLHALKIYRTKDDLWWDKSRDFLENVFVELQKANFGTLLGVPLLNVENHQIIMSIEPSKDEKTEDLFISIGKPGTPIVVEVTYLDELPMKLLQDT